MSDYANVNGSRVVSADITIPYVGLWSARVVIATQAAPPPRCTLTIADMTLSGAVYLTDQFAGLQAATLVGGSGGWGSLLPAVKYESPAGVLASLVLSDAASSCGERVVLASDFTIGNFYTREAGPASNALRILAGALWWVDPSGATQCGTTRGASPITSAFTLIDFDPAIGKLTVATENPSDWMPGRTVATPLLSTRTLSLVEHHLTNEGEYTIEALAA